MVSIVAILALLVAAFVATTPVSKAQATVYWPQIFSGTSVLNVVAHSEDNLSLVACGSSGDNGQYVKAGVAVSNDTWNGGGAYQCDLALGAAQSDGTFYAYTNNGGYTSTSLVAYKNGIQLWSTSIGYASNCSSSYTDYTAQIGAMTSSIGPDGNLYFVITPGAGYSSCQDRMLKVDPSTGTKLFDINLGVAPGPGLGYGASDMRMWTYDSKIVLMDRNDTLREFSYSGIENTSASYTFPRPTGNTIYQVTANSAGTVFAAASVNGYPHGASVIMWHKDNGTYSQIDTPSDNYLNPILVTSSSGNVSTAFNNYVRRYDVAANSYVDTSINVPSAYSAQQVMGYIEDSSGHGLLVRNLHNSSYTSLAVSVDLVDYTTSTPTFTNLFTQDGTSSPSATPQTYPMKTEFQFGVSGGYLYLPTCESGGSCSTSAPEAVQKIALTGFGTPQSDTPKRNSYQKQNYVALGDSYSSGEGLPAFLPDSNVSGIDSDQCHRSKVAYSEVLATMSLPALDLTNFSACSGAVMADIDNTGQYGEPAQKLAITSDTDVVTISIGGNDALFASTLSDCTKTHDLPEDWPGTAEEYDETRCTAAITAAANVVNGTTLLAGDKTFVESLADTYSSISSRGNANTQFYVIGYPNIFPTYANISGTCLWGVATGVLGVSDRAVSEDDVMNLRGLLDDISYDMQAEVNNLDNDNVHFVDPRTAFSGHELCTSDPYLNHIDLSTGHKGSYHPNQEGQLAYVNVLSNAIG